MHLNCPHCRNLIEVVVERLGEVVCPSCGSSIVLDPGKTGTFVPTNAPRRLGKYELIEQIGMGAFGTVCKARDTELDRVVAIKIPRAGNVSTQEDVDRFLREARSAAQLRHPGIVSVFDAGQADGTCFIASEYVQGASLADRLGAGRLTFRRAAELIAEVADALHIAHQHGVIHRDIKPSNIMIDLDGHPHVMDFGLAKRDAGEITITLDGQVLGTPAYMPPEQARGEAHAVDARGDVYSLGVILYELVTGELPFRGNSRMLIVQVIQDEPRPPRRIDDKIPRDLETITLKCMAKDPARRYPSAADLGADLRRWLGGEPIQARPVSQVERLWRWCGRNPLVAGLVTAVYFLTLAVAAISLVAVVRIRHEVAEKTLAQTQAEQNYTQAQLDRDAARAAAGREAFQHARAMRNLKKAREAVDQMLVRVGEEKLAGIPRMEPVRRALLEDALGFYLGFIEQEGEDRERLEDAVGAYRKVGEIRRLLGDHALAEVAQLEVLAIQEKLAARFPDEPRYLRDLAASLHNLARTHQSRGEVDEAESLLRRAIDLEQSALSKLPSDCAAREFLGNHWNSLGLLLRRTNRPVEALESYAAAEASYAGLAAEFPKVAGYRKMLAGTRINIGVALLGLKRYEDAEAAYRAASETQQGLVVDFPNELEYRLALARSQNNLGGVLTTTRRFEEAEAAFRTAIEIREKHVADFPDVPQIRLELAGAQVNLAGMLWKSDKFNESMEMFRVASSTLEQLTQQFPAVADHHSALGNALLGLGQAIAAQGDLAEASVLLDRAMQCQHAAIKINPRHPTYREVLVAIYRVTPEILLKLSDHVAAERVAGQWAEFCPNSATELYDAACVVARCAPLAATDPHLSETDRATAAQQYATHAIDLFRKAIAAGFEDFDYLRQDPAIASISAYAAYEEFIADINGR